MPSSAREIVHRRLIDDARRFPVLRIDALDTEDLDARDAALAHAIHGAVVRRWLTLQFLLQSRLRQRFDALQPEMQAVLLAGAAQLLILDRIPAHAAINESVEWAKRRIRPKAGAMVNAVLRRLATLRTDQRRQRWTAANDELPLPDGSAAILSEPALPEQELDRLSVATSHPKWLLKRWGEGAEALALHGLMDPPTILNTSFTDAVVPGLPHRTPGHVVFDGNHGQLVELLASHHDIWVQDPASSAAVSLAAGLKPATVLDLCAGRGTKTVQLSHVFPSATILATDTDSARLSQLQEATSTRANVRVLAPEELRHEALESAELVLLDVPCTNTGVLARRIEARYRCDSEQLDRLSQTQRQIVVDAIPLLAPGGRILLSTCSLEPEENEDLARWITRWHGLRVERERKTLPAPLPPSPDNCGAERYTDGAYAALLG